MGGSLGWAEANASIQEGQARSTVQHRKLQSMPVTDHDGEEY